MKLWVAWASGRFVRRPVKNSAILPPVAGGSAIFRWGTCSLSAEARGDGVALGKEGLRSFVPIFVGTLDSKQLGSTMP